MNSEKRNFLTIFMFLGLLIVLVVIFLFVSIPNYKSAFEADQTCHAQKFELYGNSPDYDCDHDTETKQWILYQQGKDNTAATVISRFRY